MKLHEILSEGIVWGKAKNKIVRKFRCTTGKKAGRVVSKQSDCAKALDRTKSKRLKITKKRLGNKMMKKTLRTKKFSPLSKQLAKKNQRLKK